MKSSIWQPTTLRIMVGRPQRGEYLFPSIPTLVPLMIEGRFIMKSYRFVKLATLPYIIYLEAIIKKCGPMWHLTPDNISLVVEQV